MEQGIICRISEPTEWVKSLEYVCNIQMLSVLRPQGSEQSYYMMSPSDSHNGGAHIQTLWCQVLFQTGCQKWILVDQTWFRITATHHFPLSFLKILLPKNAFLPGDVPRCIPAENGYNSGEMSSYIRTNWWCHSVWQNQRGSWLEFAQTNENSADWRFNSEKCTVDQKQIHFFGAIYDENRIYPDLKNVEEIKILPSMKTITDL